VRKKPQQKKNPKEKKNPKQRKNPLAQKKPTGEKKPPAKGKEKSQTGPKGEPPAKKKKVSKPDEKDKSKEKGKKTKKLPKGKQAKLQLAKQKALAIQKVIKKGKRSKIQKKVHYNVRFRRPRTKTLPRNPKYPRKSFPKKNPLHEYSIVQYPVTSESAMQQIENNSTLVFIVDRRAKKRQIKLSVEKLYQIKAAKVNTLIRPDGLKKAYVRLSPEYDALEVANKIGMI